MAITCYQETEIIINHSSKYYDIEFLTSAKAIQQPTSASTSATQIHISLSQKNGGSVSLLTNASTKQKPGILLAIFKKTKKILQLNIIS